LESPARRTKKTKRGGVANRVVDSRSVFKRSSGTGAQGKGQKKETAKGY